VKLGAASTKGVPPSPRGNGTNNNGKAEEAAREGMRQFYRNF
jgi:hypothetical protein